MSEDDNSQFTNYEFTKDLRIIDRDALIMTIRDYIDRLTSFATQDAMNGDAQACFLKMGAVGEMEMLFEEIRAETKHLPDAPRMAEPGELL